jgi:hypothetical protein
MPLESAGDIPVDCGQTFGEPDPRMVEVMTWVLVGIPKG